MEVSLPYVAVRGARPGKTLWLNGQVHGDEINGMVAALRFIGGLDPATLRGNVVVTPTGNPQALDSRRKRNPLDDLDLDQSYPGSPDGLISARLAHALIDEVAGVADVLVNLHTLNPLFSARPYAVYKVCPEGGISEATLLDYASVFSPAVACRMDVSGAGELPGNIAGALDYQCLIRGIGAFMVELGSGSRFEPENVALGERGFGMLAARLRIVADAPGDAPATLRRVTRRRWVTASDGGLFVAEARPGDVLAAGDRLGSLLSLRGDQRPVMALDVPAVMIAVRNDPVTHTGERLAFAGTEWNEWSLRAGRPF
jgi:predicted deacylase